MILSDDAPKVVDIFIRKVLTTVEFGILKAKKRQIFGRK